MVQLWEWKRIKYVQCSQPRKSQFYFHFSDMRLHEGRNIVQTFMCCLQVAGFLQIIYLVSLLSIKSSRTRRKLAKPKRTVRRTSWGLITLNRTFSLFNGSSSKEKNLELDNQEWILPPWRRWTVANASYTSQSHCI